MHEIELLFTVFVEDPDNPESEKKRYVMSLPEFCVVITWLGLPSEKKNYLISATEAVRRAVKFLGEHSR